MDISVMQKSSYIFVLRYASIDNRITDKKRL